MELKIVSENGLKQALIGMKFSFQEECEISKIQQTAEDINKHMKTAIKLCRRDHGHNKFLEQIQVHIVVRATLDFWKQIDTYRVGTSKLSKSTMHTIMRSPLNPELFHNKVDQKILDVVEGYRLAGDFDGVSKNLPQGFLQTRMINTNYKVLRNIIIQRKEHKLPEWEQFIDCILNQLQNAELIGV